MLLGTAEIKLFSVHGSEIWCLDGLVADKLPNLYQQMLDQGTSFPSKSCFGSQSCFCESVTALTHSDFL